MHTILFLCLRHFLFFLQHHFFLQTFHGQGWEKSAAFLQSPVISGLL